MKRKIVIGIIPLVIIATISPIIMATTEDAVIITFDPDGDIDIDVSPVNYSFGSIISGSWSNTTGNTFTLYNNGTIYMDVRIKTNATTDEGNLTLDPDGNPGIDFFSIETSGFDIDDYLPSSYGTTFDENLSPGGNKAFDLHLNIGIISANHSQQTTTIYFQGSIGAGV